MIREIINPVSFEDAEKISANAKVAMYQPTLKHLQYIQDKNGQHVNCERYKVVPIRKSSIPIAFRSRV